MGAIRVTKFLSQVNGACTIDLAQSASALCGLMMTPGFGSIDRRTRVATDSESALTEVIKEPSSVLVIRHLGGPARAGEMVFTARIIVAFAVIFATV